METISKKQLEKIANGGAKVHRKSSDGKRKESDLSTTTTSLDSAAIKRLENLSRSTDQHINAVNRSTEAQIKALVQLMQQQDTDQAVLISRMMDILAEQKTKTAYRFVINRDTKGIMKSVDAHPIGDK